MSSHCEYFQEVAVVRCIYIYKKNRLTGNDLPLTLNLDPTQKV